MSDMQPLGVGERAVVLLRPASWEADRYRTVRRSLTHFDRERWHILAIASPSAREGKTTTAINLAAALAELPGASVLLVDADFRCSAVAGALGMEPFPGHDLGEVASNGALGLDDVVVRIPELFPFAVVPSRSRTDAAHEIVESPRIAELLAAARKTYDYVIVDAPPIVPMADCRALAPLCDGFLIVVRAHRTSHHLLGEALSSLPPRQVLGLVLNEADEPAWARSHRYYSHYGRPH
ncbi:MAG: CpsD/CapB family tyrosine-protein kinase [Myxococcales bacterium]|nr:CpsD/CapB family tyrosine-protein kinase [Myxococcales bacterium]